MTNKITALTPQLKNHQRINVFLDGEFAFGLTRFVAAWLYIGQELDETKIEQLKKADQIETAYQRTLNYINYRDRSVSEVNKYLQKFNLTQQEIEDVINRLKEINCINDKRFACTWVENRTEFRPRSPRALKYELHHLGISDGEIDHAIEGLDEDQLAIKAASRQATRYANLEWLVFRKKMYGFLSRRGFSSECATNAIRKVWAEEIMQATNINKTSEEVTR